MSASADRALKFLEASVEDVATDTEMERIQFDDLDARITADLAAAHETIGE